MSYGITKEELHPSLLQYIQSIAGTGSGSGGSSNFKYLKSNTTLAQSSNEVTIGITGYNSESDLLLVYKNRIYIENGVDYSVSADNLKIVALSGETWSQGSYFSFICLKNVPELSDYSVDGTKLLLQSVSLDKLDQTLQDFVNNAPHSVVNDLTTGGIKSALSAEQGKVLNTTLTDVKNKADDWNNFKTSGGTIGGVISFPGEIGNRFLQQNLDVNGRKALVKTAAANYNGYPSWSYAIDDLDNDTNSNGIVYLLGTGIDSDPYKDNYFRPIKQGYNSSKNNIGSPNVPWDDIFIGVSNKSTDGYVTLTNGFILQWATVDLDFSSAQTHDVSVSYPLAFVGDAYGNCWCNVRSNSVNTKYVIANVTAINRSSCILRASATKTLTGTITVRVYAIGTMR